MPGCFFCGARDFLGCQGGLLGARYLSLVAREHLLGTREEEDDLASNTEDCGRLMNISDWLWVTYGG